MTGMVVVLLVVVLGLVVAAVGVAAVVGGRRSVPGAVALVVVAVLVVVIAGGLVGLSGEREERAPVGDERAEDRVEDRRPAVVAAPARPVDLRLHAGPTGRPFPALLLLLDGLPAVTTRLVLVRDAGPITLHQCVMDAGTVRRCGAGVPTSPQPVREGDEDGATGLVELRRRANIGSGVDCAVERCVLASADDAGTVVPLADLGFGEPGPVATLTVEPARGVEPGDPVEVVVAGGRPGSLATLRWCAVPGPTDPGACDGAAQQIEVQVASSGQTVAQAEVPDREVGDGRECTRRSPCALVLEVDGGRPVAQAVVTLAGLSGPDLSRQQIAGGIAAAMLLVAAAVLIHRRTDWRGPDGDVFEAVSLSVPEWEGVSLDVPEWDEVAPLGSDPAPGGHQSSSV